MPTLGELLERGDVEIVLKRNLREVLPVLTKLRELEVGLGEEAEVDETRSEEYGGWHEEAIEAMWRLLSIGCSDVLRVLAAHSDHLGILWEDIPELAYPDLDPEYAKRVIGGNMSSLGRHMEKREFKFKVHPVSHRFRGGRWYMCLHPAWRTWIKLNSPLRRSDED